MTVQFVCPEGSDLTRLQKEYSDLYHDDTYDGHESWWIGKCGDEYWDSERDIYNYGEDGPYDLSKDRDYKKEWMTWEGSAEFCGFAETLIADSDTMIEGNGGWAQNELREGEDYRRGVCRAESIIAKGGAE